MLIKTKRPMTTTLTTNDELTVESLVVHHAVSAGT